MDLALAKCDVSGALDRVPIQERLAGNHDAPQVHLAAGVQHPSRIIDSCQTCLPAEETASASIIKQLRLGPALA
jgi:hypothetical protein